MKLCLFTALFFSVLLQDVRFKPNEEFDIKLQYEFRQRVMNDNTTIYPSDGSGAGVRKTSSSMLPYLDIKLRLVKLQPEEVRLRIVNNRGESVFGRKIKEGDVALINMGFTDDVKDRVSAHEYTATFLTADRKETSRILITVNKDGTFLVNNEKRGKTILITGGSAGIGLEAAKQFLANGAKVIITGRDQLKLDKAKKLYPALIAIKNDAGNPEDAQLLFHQIKELGGIDILYNNAGVLSMSTNMGIADDRHLKEAVYEMNVNYFGVIRLNNLFMEMLKSRKEGVIINTTSILSYVPSVLEATYSASKVALRFYTETLRKHLGVLNSPVKVFELLPPLVATEMTAGRNDKKITAEQLVKTLIAGLKKNQLTIRVGDTKLVYIIHRLFPKMAFGLINPKKNTSQSLLQNSTQ